MKNYFNPFGRFFWKHLITHIPSTAIIVALFFITYSFWIYHQGRTSGISEITPEGWVKSQVKILHKSKIKVAGAKKVLEINLNPRELLKSERVIIVQRENDFLGMKPAVKSIEISNVSSLFQPRLGMITSTAGVGVDFQVIRWQKLTGDLVATQEPFLGAGAGYYFTKSLKGFLGGGVKFSKTKTEPSVIGGISWMF